MTPATIPDHIAETAHDFAEALAFVAGDEAAVLDVLAQTGREIGNPDDAAALCVSALAFTYARCVVVTEPITRSTPTEGDQA